jgi:hypothetical protein
MTRLMGAATALFVSLSLYTPKVMATSPVYPSLRVQVVGANAYLYNTRGYQVATWYNVRDYDVRGSWALLRDTALFSGVIDENGTRLVSWYNTVDYRLTSQLAVLRDTTSLTGIFNRSGLRVGQWNSTVDYSVGESIVAARDNTGLLGIFNTNGKFATWNSTVQYGTSWYHAAALDVYGHMALWGADGIRYFDKYGVRSFVMNYNSVQIYYQNGAYELYPL